LHRPVSERLRKLKLAVLSAIRTLAAPELPDALTPPKIRPRKLNTSLAPAPPRCR
jgi:hypothetical protein